MTPAVGMKARAGVRSYLRRRTVGKNRRRMCITLARSLRSLRLNSRCSRDIYIRILIVMKG